ncbi:MAG: MYXO-CTERM sorting domain-containing protein [Planctomycetota bacterium]|jgi:hypothetical protein
MRYILALIAVSFAGVLCAQSNATPGVTCDVVIHEPTAAQVGPYIAGLPQEPNPDYTPTNGQPQFLDIYGDGKGLANLDTITNHMYALAGTTTHDLIFITNSTAAAINFNGAQPPVVLAPRPKYDYAQAPENGQPGWFAPPTLYVFDSGAFSIGVGASSAAILVRTKWMGNLDTSPRDYIIPIQFQDLGPPVSAMVVDVALTVPYMDNANGSGGCAVSKGNLPTGLALIGGAALVAILRRRRKLAKI